MATVGERIRGVDPGIRLAILLALAIAGVAVLVAVGPIVRAAYTYRFPDDRQIWGVPYFFNVVTNLPFVIVGAIGLATVRGKPTALRPALAILYLGILLTGFGSAFHHLAPSFDRLLFDRLPMTLAFAGVFAVALGDRIDPRLAVTWLGPLLATASASAVFWYVTGELRPYVFVQGYPMVAIPVMLLLSRGHALDGRHFMAAVGLYAIAKVFERYDAEVYELGHLMSGHSIKHLFAGWATWHLVAMAGRHRPSR